MKKNNSKVTDSPNFHELAHYAIVKGELKMKLERYECKHECRFEIPALHREIEDITRKIETLKKVLDLVYNTKIKICYDSCGYVVIYDDIFDVELFRHDLIGESPNEIFSFSFVMAKSVLSSFFDNYRLLGIRELDGNKVSIIFNLKAGCWNMIYDKYLEKVISITPY